MIRKARNPTINQISRQINTSQSQVPRLCHKQIIENQDLEPEFGLITLASVSSHSGILIKVSLSWTLVEQCCFNYEFMIDNMIKFSHMLNHKVDFALGIGNIISVQQPGITKYRWNI